MLRGLSEDEKKKVLPDDTILSGFRGSIAHGMYIPQSDPNSIDDKDVMGVRILPIENYFGLRGLWKPKPEEISLREWDILNYEIRHFFHLLLKQNPNVLCLLWLDEKYYIKKTEIGERLIQNRNLFVSKKAYHSFTGYAYGQLKRMTAFNKQGYMGDKRKKIVEKYGYDIKNAAHLIRLLRMGIEFLTEGRLIVERPDAELLLEIKRGNWELERVKTEANRLFKLTEEAYIRSSLPSEPNYEEAEKLLVNILIEYFGEWNHNHKMKLA